MFDVAMEKTKGRLINLPPTLWVYLEADAERCKRSVTKQIEAIIDAYFEIQSVDLSGDAIKYAQKKNNLVGNKQLNLTTEQPNGSAAQKMDIEPEVIEADYLGTANAIHNANLPKKKIK